MNHAREALRQALGDENRSSPGTGKESGKGNRPADARRNREENMRVDVRGDRPHTFIVKGDLYITIGSADDAKK